MNNAIVIRGKIRQGTFFSDEPVPDMEAPAELIVYPEGPQRNGEEAGRSIYDLFGKAETLRTGDEIDAQLRDERSWGDQ